MFTQLGLADSVPGTALVAPTVDDVEQLGIDRLLQYSSALARMARPYKVDIRGRATRSEVTPTRVDAAGGLVSTVRDLAKFDAVLRYGILLESETLVRAWSAVGPTLPTGLGWFVQNYNGTAVVWQFGAVADGYSSLVLKLPTRGVTLVLLANSDGLDATSELPKGDVTASVFARTFLRLYVP